MSSRLIDLHMESHDIIVSSLRGRENCLDRQMADQFRFKATPALIMMS
jgi:hypothetical protein